jgi:hypothetical protein
MRTYNGGSSWEKVETGNAEEIMSLYINGGETCWSVGGNGCILEYSSIFTGVPVQGEAKPGLKFTAVPNPFVDKTVVTYVLDKPQKVVITLFSIAGNNIEVIENAQQESGSHSVSIENAKLKPGVYLCQLKTGSITQTVKLMVLTPGE